MTAVVASGTFFALVKSVRTGMFSNKVSCLFVETLSGSVTRGEQIEIVGPEGVRTVIGRGIRQGIGETVLDLDDPHPGKDELAGATLARSAGLRSPRLPESQGPGLERLLGAIRAARAAGFPEAWASPIRATPALKPGPLCELLRSLPDEAVALLVQKRVRDAMGHHDNPFSIVGDVEGAAMLLSAIGLAEDGDRLLLTASAAVQGHKPAPVLRAAATAGAIGVLATEPVAAAGLDIGRRVGWAIGIEMGDAFATAFQSSVAAGGEVTEQALLDAGRAVGVARCNHCHEVVELRYSRSGLTGSAQHHCPTDGHKVDKPTLVVPGDVPDAMEAIRLGDTRS
ncbi:MAG TPA: hypothetical protein VFP19_07960 [Candidatus Limnocylindrales bacterium]|nr:hypothetical protein [Candidatus Limnocylindrales bacterium]